MGNRSKHCFRWRFLCQIVFNLKLDKIQMKTSSTYIYIDNFEDYKFYREKYKSKNVNWVTSSPYLIHIIKTNNELVLNLENYLSPKIVNQLMPMSYKLSESIINNSHKNLTFFGHKKETQLIFYRDLSVMIGSFLYKYYALYCFLIDKKKIIRIYFYWKKNF